MVKKLGQRRFLLKSGYTEEELDRMSPSTAHSLIRDMEETNRKRREKEALMSQLKDSNEIIKEIGELLKNIYNSNTCWYDMSWYMMAKIVYEKLLPEGSVVLTKEAYINDFNNQFNKGYKHGSKETAKKILKDIMFCIDINDCNKNEMLILNLCKMLAKQFGVEVEE